MATYTLDARLEAQNNASAEIASLSAELGLLSAQLDRIDGRELNVKVDLDAGAALARLEAFETAKQRSARDVRVDVDVDTAGAVAQLVAFEAARAAASRDIKVDVEVDRIDEASMGIRALTVGLTILRRGLSAMVDSIPIAGGTLSRLGSAAASAVSQLAPLGAAGIAVGGALAALAVITGGTLVAALGVLLSAITPVVAVLGVAGTAAAGLALGVGLLAAPILLVVREITKYNKSLKEQEQAQKQVTTAANALRSAQEREAEASRSVADAQRRAVESVAAAVEQYTDSLKRVQDAEQGVRDARDALGNATRDLLAQQQNLNEALRDEPLNQREATLDLAEARDRLTETTRSYNEAVVRYGANSEQATDALRSMQRAEIALERQEQKTTETRQRGSSQLLTAQSQYRRASEEQRSSSRRVQTAVEALANSMLQSERAQRGIRRAQLEGSRQIEAAKRSESQAQLAVAAAVNNIAKAQRDAQASTVSLSAAARMLQGAWESLKRSAPAGLLAAAKLEAAALAVDILGLARFAMPSLLVASINTTRAMREGFYLVGEQVGGSAANSLNGILSQIPALVNAGTRAVSFFAAGFLNFMNTGLPYAQAFLDSIAGTAERFFRWSDSAAGRQDIKAFLDSATPLARELGYLFREVGAELYRLGVDHGPVAAKALGLITYAAHELFKALDFVLNVLDRIARFIQDNPRIYNAFAGMINRVTVGIDPMPYASVKAYGGDVAMAEGGIVPGSVPFAEAANGLDIPSHYVQSPTVMSLSGLDVLYGEALSGSNREYAFRDGGNMRFITEEPGYDANSYNLWRDLGERKGYFAPNILQKNQTAHTRARPEKTLARIQVMLDGKTIKEYTTEVIWENLKGSGAQQEFGL